MLARLVRRLPEASDDDGMETLLRPFQLRTVRIGVWTTWLVLVVMVVYPFLPGSEPIALGLYLGLLVVAALAVILVSLLPWRWLFDRRFGQWALYAWSALDIILISILIAISGYEDSEAFFLFAPVMVFFAASYPFRGQIALTSVTVVSYVAALLLGPPVSIASLFVRLGTLLALLYLASFLSRELTWQMRSHSRARADAEWRAFHDDLTGLGNRSLVAAQLDEAVRGARPHALTAVLLVDLDHFKTYNDLFGHAFGDLLLVEVARRISHAVGSEGEVGRIGGDEFVVIASGLPGEAQADELAARILDALSRPAQVDGVRVHLPASVGVATVAHPAEPDLVLRQADMAVYAAKGQGRECSVRFDERMEIALRERHDLERELRRAIDDDEFEMYYQPLVALDTRRVVGLEALVRWRHPSRGLVHPTAFIPTAEALGLIVPLGRIVIERTCSQVGDWRRRGILPPDMPVNVNVSTAQLVDAGFPETVQGILRRHDLPASALKLEVTESALAEHASAAVDCLSELRALGLEIALDDFGTGYSSLGYLGIFPVDTVKIDRSFVSRLGTDADALVLVRGIVDLARNLNLTVVAEGVEEASQAELLAAIGCPVGQGYLFACPAPAGEVEALLTAVGRLRQTA